MAKKYDIKVYDTSGDTILAKFDTFKELYAWNKKHSVRADQVAINNLVMYGWDEIDDFDELFGESKLNKRNLKEAKSPYGANFGKRMGMIAAMMGEKPGAGFRKSSDPAQNRGYRQGLKAGYRGAGTSYYRRYNSAISNGVSEKEARRYAEDETLKLKKDPKNEFGYVIEKWEPALDPQYRRSLNYLHTQYPTKDIMLKAARSYMGKNMVSMGEAVIALAKQQGLEESASKFEINVGDTFDTESERGCTVLSHPDADGNFLGLDSDGEEVQYNVVMVTILHDDDGFWGQAWAPSGQKRKVFIPHNNPTYVGHGPMDEATNTDWKYATDNDECKCEHIVASHQQYGNHACTICECKGFRSKETKDENFNTVTESLRSYYDTNKLGYWYRFEKEPIVEYRASSKNKVIALPSLRLTGKVLETKLVDGKWHVNFEKRLPEVTAKQFNLVAEDGGLVKESYDAPTRLIRTGLTGPVNKEILESVMGQLSDGMWENTPAMSKYWKNAEIEDVDGQIFIVVKDGWDSGFRNRDEKWIRNFFAGKMKILVYDELGLGGGKSWSRQDTSTLSYFGHGDREITVSSVYRAYETLKGRKTKDDNYPAPPVPPAPKVAPAPVAPPAPAPARNYPTTTTSGGSVYRQAY